MTSHEMYTRPPYFQNPTKKTIEPRIGIAWDPFGDGKTSVRAAFGFFDVVPLPAAFSLAIDQSAPFYNFLSFSPPPCSPFPTCVGDAINTAFINNTNPPLQTTFIDF